MLLLAAIGGAVMGSILATRHNTPLVRTTATSTASVLLLTGCFSGKILSMFEKLNTI
jgi:hypothetical protein